MGEPETHACPSLDRPALGRRSQLEILKYLERKLSAVIVHPAAVHQAQDVPDAFGLQNLLFGDGAYATVGQGGCHHGHGVAISLHGATLIKSREGVQERSLDLEEPIRLSQQRTYLEIEVHDLPQVRLVRVAMILPHVEPQSVVPVSDFPLR